MGSVEGAHPDLHSLFSSEGRVWGVGSVVVGFRAFWGAPTFSPEVPKHILQGFGASRRKIGVPQKREIQPRWNQPLILGPLISGIAPICSDFFRFAPICSQNKSGKPLSADPFASP